MNKRSTNQKKAIKYFAVFIFVIAFNPNYLNAQPPFQWAKRMGGSSKDMPSVVTVDQNCNIYTTGIFQDTADFDPGPGVFNLIGVGSWWNGYISKLDANGNFLWAKHLAGIACYPGPVVIDACGNLYISGSFEQTVDFDPGPGVFNLTVNPANNEFRDGFILKLDANGNFLWVKQIGGTQNTLPGGMKLDVAGNIYMTGAFSGTVDFNPAVGTFNLVSVNTDAFILKLDGNGNFVWAKHVGGNVACQGGSIGLNAFGEIYVEGRYWGSIDFNPGVGIFNLTSAGICDVFVLKLDALGNFVWAKSMGGTGYDYGDAMTVDASGNVLTTGSFEGTSDFDPGSGVYNLTSSPSNPTTGYYDHNIFVSKLDANGNFLWAKQVGGVSAEESWAIAVDPLGDVYTTGYFMTPTVDFDPGPSVFNLTTSGVQSGNIFILKLNAAGDFVWAAEIGSIVNDSIVNVGHSLIVPTPDNIYTVGQFRNTVDFDPGPGVFTLTAPGPVHPYPNEEAYILKLGTSSNCNNSQTYSPVITPLSSTNICVGDSVILSAGSGYLSYYWLPLGQTSPTITVYSPGNYSVIATFNCGIDTSAAIAVTVNLPPTVALSATSPIICSGDSTTITVTGASAFSWSPVTGLNSSSGATVTASPSTTTTYTVTTTNGGCVVTQAVVITVNNLPLVNLTPISPIICSGASAVINATGASTYTWSPSTGLNLSSGATVTANPSMTTTYTVTGTNGSCVDTQTVIVTVNPSPILIVSGTPSTICVGNSASINALGATTYTWSPSIGLSSTTGSSVTANPNVTTTYTVVGTSNACTDTSTQTIVVNSLPVISLTNDLTIIQGTSTVLSVSGGGSYNWSPVTALSCTTCTNPTANPLASTTYCVDVTDNGCVSSECVNIAVDIQCGELFVPNVFSPNSDGKNDVLEVKININCVRDFNMVIFDRWGEKVFESNDINITWDGSYKGKALDNATFVYYLKITSLNTDSPISKKGNVSIIK